jgi:hypothetical protein
MRSGIGNNAFLIAIIASLLIATRGMRMAGSWPGSNGRTVSFARNELLPVPPRCRAQRLDGVEKIPKA